MADTYTKIVLTIIAAALVALTAIQMTPSANAADGVCGESERDPCHVKLQVRSYDAPLPVIVKN